jgi:hypothetical protein
MATAPLLIIFLLGGPLGQFPGPADLPVPPPPAPVPPQASSDKYFSEVVENFVISSVVDPSNRWADRTLDGNVGAEGARLLRSLGCGRQECRDLAAELIEAEGERAFRWLLWGERSIDPHIRHESTRLIDRLFYRCAYCEGAGGRRDAWATWDRCEGCDGEGVWRH